MPGKISGHFVIPFRYIWNEQRGSARSVNTLITRPTGWRLHHCRPLCWVGQRVPKPATTSSSA